MSSKRFKGITSISDMLGWQTSSFNEFLKIDSSGISQYTMEEIKAKSAVLGLTDELTAQAVALAKDADFTAKAATGKLTWGKALADAGDDVEDIGKVLLDSGKLTDDWQTRLTNAFNSDNKNNLKQNIMDAMNSVDGLSDSIIDLGSTGKEAGSSLSNIFKGLVATFVKLLPLITAVGAAFVAYKLYDWATLSYSEARDNLDSSTLSYQQTKDELESLNSELETTTSRIEELRELQANGSITIVEEAELEKLERENASLERQIEIKQKLAEIQAQEQINAAKTVLDYKSETINDTDSTGFVKTDFTGGIKTKQVDRFEWVQEQMKFYTQAKENVVSAEKALVEATSRYDAGEISKKQLGQYETNLKNNENAVTEYEEAISSKLAEIGADIEGLYVNGKLSEEGEVYVRQFNELSDAFNNIDLSPAEKKLKSIESFFDGSKSRNVLKDELIKIAKSGNITEDSLASLSLTLEDLGLSGSDGLSTLNRYFKDLTKSIDTASDAVEGFDGSLESITKAGESENQDNNWNVTAALFKKAKGLDDSKKWGTDDFQSMAQFIAPEGSIINTKNSYLKATDYKDLWDKYYSNFKKYFDEDNPLQSAINAQDKLISSGLGTMGKDGIVRWTKEFKSSSDAAKAWGISVEAAEIAMHNLESYGAEFDGINFDGEELDKYKNSLEGIRSIYESLDDGSQKDRLGELLKSFDEQYAVFEGDLSELKEDQIVKIKFEYDLASIQQKIEELKDLAFATGSNEDWAAVTVSQKQERELLENKTGYTKASDEGYSASYDKITSLRENMKGKAEEERAAINTEIAAIQELQNAFQIFKLDGGQLDWNSYIQSDKATKALNEIKEATGLTREQIAELFGLKPEDMKFDVEADTTDAENKIKGVLSNDGTTITMNVDASTEEINNQLNSLQEGQRLLFSAEVDDKGIQAIEAVKRQDGSIVYTAIDNGVQYYLQEVKHEDGTITYTLGEVPTEVPPTDQEVYRHPNNEEVLNPAPSTTQTVKRKPDNTEVDKDPPNIFQKVIRYVTGTNLSIASASGTITPALASGTAYNVINPKPLSAFAKGDISLPQDEVALVNELGTEGLIRDGKLMAIPGGMHMQALRKGDIILSVEQMKALYATGKASGHARAYANGTILSSAYGNAMPSLGGSYGKSYSNSSTSKSSTSKNTNTSKDKDSSSNSDTEKKFEETLDLVKIYLERQERRTEKLVNAIDDAVGLVDKQAATNKAISQVQAEIQANQKAYNTYKQKADAVGLSSDYKNKIINGQLSIETITDESLNDSIQEFQQWYDEMLGCEDKIDDLKDKLKDLAQTKFDNVTTEFENQISLIEHETKMLESTIDLIESQGYIVTRDYYDNLIKQEEENYNKLQSEYKTLTDTLNDLLNQKLIEKYSDQWYDMTNSINEVSEAILDSQKALVEYKNAIRDLEWDFFDKTQDMLSQIQAESDFLVELMSNDKMYDSETGKITDKGQATLGLHAVNYNAYMSQADDYAKEIANIDKELADDPNNQTLLERRQELLETQRDMIKSAEEEKQAIKDLVSDGYDAFLEVMQKAIDKRKELLTNIKDLYDYEKNIAEQTKEISALEKQLNAYQGDTSEEAKSTIQQLKVSLEEAKKNLEETEYDKYISDQEQMLDSLYSETEEWINSRLDNLELIIQNVIDSTNENSESIKETLTNEAESVGTTLSDAMNSIWSPDGTYTSVVTTYGDNFSSLLTTTNSTLATIRKYVAKMAGITESEENTSKPSTPKPSTPNTDNSSNNSTNNNTSSSSSGKWGSWFISKKDSYPKNKLDKDKSIVDRLRYFDYDFSMSARAKYYKAMGKTDTYTGSATQNQWMLSEMKKNGFKKGGTIGSLIKRTGEDGYILARTGEEILSLDKIDALKDTFITMDSMFKNLIKLPEMPQSQVNNGNVTNEITFHFELPNVRNADDFVNALKNDKRCEKIIQQMTLGAMTGKNSLLKYNY